MHVGKNPWHDRFARPEAADLARLYEPERAAVLDHLLDMIGTRTGARPATEWRGIAWRWTLVFTRPTDAEPWAYIIPTDERPTLALPVPANPLPQAQLKRMARFIRDTIRHAPRVGRVCWIEFPIETAGQIDDLRTFIDLVTEPQPA